MPAGLTLTIPRSDNKTADKYRKADISYYNKASTALNEMGFSGVISKIIIGDTHSKKWAQGDNSYRNANEPLINVGEYDADDVVLLSDTGTRKKSTKASSMMFSKKTTNFSELQQNLKSAIEAGATLVLDSDFNNKTLKGLKSIYKKH